MSEMQAGQVTLADLFRVLSAIQGDLAQMATRLEVVNARNTHADAVDSDHETRIRSLEQFKWKLAGLAIALSVVISAIVGWLPGHLR